MTAASQPWWQEKQNREFTVPISASRILPRRSRENMWTVQPLPCMRQEAARADRQSRQEESQEDGQDPD